MLHTSIHDLTKCDHYHDHYHYEFDYHHWLLMYYSHLYSVLLVAIYDITLRLIRISDQYRFSVFLLATITITNSLHTIIIHYWVFNIQIIQCSCSASLLLHVITMMCKLQSIISLIHWQVCHAKKKHGLVSHTEGWSSIDVWFPRKWDDQKLPCIDPWRTRVVLRHFLRP